MPSLYLTARNSGDAIPLFVKKQIAFLMPGRVSIPSLFVSTKEYFFYPLAFLQMAVICCATKLVTQLDSSFCPIFKGIKLASVFNRPVCTFRFGKLTPDQVTNLKAMGLVQDLTNSSLFVGSPGPEHLPVIWKMGPVEDRLRPGHVGSDGFLAWCYLMKGVQAFITARNNTDGRANLRYSLKQSVKFDKEGDILRVGKELFKGKHGFDSGRSIVTTNDIFLHPPAEDLSTLPGSFTQLSVAKSMPDTTCGFFFPYFSGLNLPDKEIAAAVFSRFFTHTLASTLEAQTTLMRQVISGNRTLAYSDAGLALSHIYRIFDLSLQVPECSLTVVLKGSTYMGMVMSCAPDTVIKMYGHNYVAEQINMEIRKVDLLDSQAEKIVDLLSGAMEVDGVVKRVYEKSDFLDSRSALRSWNSINQMAYTASNILADVKAILTKMEFADTFAPITASNVQRALTAMISKDFSGLRDFPAYLGGTVLNDRSSIPEALSMFGPSVPSCNTGLDKNSVLISIPASDKTDGNLVTVNGTRPLKYLPFYSVPQGTGVQQWSSMFNKAVIRIPAGRKDKKEFANLHRAIFQVGGSDELTMLYSGIKQICEEIRTRSKAGEKRKRDDTEGSGSAKRGRVMESDTLDEM